MSAKQQALRGLKMMAALCCIANPLLADQFGRFTSLGNGSEITISRNTCTMVGQPETGIRDLAFSSRTNGIGVTIPSSEDDPFYSRLPNVPLPDTVTLFVTVATYDCGGLTSVIGSGPGAFVRCGGLTGALLFRFVRCG